MVLYLDNLIHCSVYTIVRLQVAMCSWLRGFGIFCNVFAKDDARPTYFFLLWYLSESLFVSSVLPTWSFKKWHCPIYCAQSCHISEVPTFDSFMGSSMRMEWHGSKDTNQQMVWYVMCTQVACTSYRLFYGHWLESYILSWCQWSNLVALFPELRHIFECTSKASCTFHHAMWAFEDCSWTLGNL